MARCPDCNKFVGYDTDQEPEIEEVQVFSDSKEIQGSVRVVLSCSECGTELKESYQEFAEDFEHECEIAGEAELDEDEELFELDDSSAVFHERMQTHTPKGKLIKNPRYAKRYYGAAITVSIKCNHCKEVFDVDITTEEQASYFDEV